MTYRTDEFNYNYSTDLIHRENYCSPMRLQPPPKEMGSQTSKIKEIYLKQFNFPNCGNSSKFKILVKIGRGIFGEVFKAQNKKNPNQIVVLKKVFLKNDKEGFPIATLREIRILQSLKHDNVISLLEICQSTEQKINYYRSTFYLVFEFCEHNLAALLSNDKLIFDLEEIKQVLKQLLKGLYYIHAKKILHLDIKTANIFITKSGILKLADFGLAQTFSLEKNKNNQYVQFTNHVVTLWYRPPELLLGERNYGPSIDLWGVGCIMAEMWTRNPIFQGNSEQSQLTLISKLCGSITPEVWPNVIYLDLYNRLELVKGQKKEIREYFKKFLRNPFAMDLLEKLLTLDPEKRIDADSALDHDFFWTDPMPCDLYKVLSELRTCNYNSLIKNQTKSSAANNQVLSRPTTSEMYKCVF